MPRDIMSEQQINIQFVKEVKKHPTLYNIGLPSYSRKDLSDKAWEEVSRVTNMTPSACREKWRNLRAVFRRTIKTPRKRRNPYYLSDVLQFLVPFIRPVAASEAAKELLNASDSVDEAKSVASIPCKQENTEPTLIEADETIEENLDCEDSVDWSIQSAEDVTKPSLVEVDRIIVENLKCEDSDNLSIHSVEGVKLTPKRSIHNNEKHYESIKVPHIVQPSPSTITEHEHVQSFLNSLLPELNEMNTAQFKKFKRRVLVLVDDIMADIPSSQDKTSR